MIVVENHTQNIAAPTTAPMIDAHAAMARSRRVGYEYSDLMTMPALGFTAHVTGQVSFAVANVVISKAWAPPPRRVSL